MRKEYQLERLLGDTLKAVQERRRLVGDAILRNVPWRAKDFDHKGFYKQVYGRNCENVVGYMTLPIGLVRDLVVNGETFQVPLATSEGALVASTNRGATAIRDCGGVRASVLQDGMTRSPVVALPSVEQAIDLKEWVEQNMDIIKETFSSTTRFGRLESAQTTVAGRNVFIRFRAQTGDAMGMNMVGKGVHAVMEDITQRFPNTKLISLSSNMCTDKKPSMINWIQGRGKSVVAEATLSRQVVENVLKTTIPDLVQLHITKNLVGSALAGSIGGNNAHAANIVTGIFLATGQDPAQNLESSNAMLLMEPIQDSLHVSITMPSIEVGTLGGGTSLPSQRGCLELLGVYGASEPPGEHSKKLANIIAATVLAGEISLNAALASNHLIEAHMDLNR